MRLKPLVWIAAAALVTTGAGVAAAESLQANADAAESCQAYRDAEDKEGYRACKRDAFEDAMKDRLAGKRHDHRPPPFSIDNGTVTGKWVTFTVSGDDGALLDYTSVGPFADAVLFDSVTLAGYEPGSGAHRAKGGLYVAQAPGIGLVAFNAPNAALALASDTGGVVTFDPADALEVTTTVDDNGTITAVHFTNGDHTATLTGRGDATYVLNDDGTVTVTLGEKSAVGVGIEGYPRLAAKEKHVAKKVFSHMFGDVDGGDRDADGDGERERPQRGTPPWARDGNRPQRGDDGAPATPPDDASPLEA